MGIFKKLFDSNLGTAQKEAVLLAEPHDREATLRIQALTSAGYTVDRVNTCVEAEHKLAQKNYQIVLSSLLLPDKPSLDLIATARNHSKDTVIIVYADEHDEKVLLEALRAGANYCTPALEQCIAQLPSLVKLAQEQLSHKPAESEPVRNEHRIFEYRGSIQNTPIPRLLRSLYQQSLTGALHIVREGIKTSLYLTEGSLVFATSSASETRLGEQMVRNGQITEDELAAARRFMEKMGLRFGTALTMLGVIQMEELKPLIVQHVLSLVYSTFDWTSGEFIFEQGAQLKNEVVLSLSTADAIFAGIRHLSRRDLIDRWLGDCDRILIPTSDPFSLFQALTLNKKEIEVIEQIVEPMSVNQVRRLKGMDEDVVARTLCGLMETGMLVPFETEHDRLVVEMPRFSELFASCPELSTIEAQTAMEFCYEVESTLRQIKDCDHYGALGVNRNARPQQIASAYYHLAKKFHPDRHSQLANYHLNLRADLKAIFEKISQAYYTLSDDQRRAAYDLHLAERPQQIRSAATQNRTTMPLPQVDIHKLGFEHYHAALQHYNRRDFDQARAELLKAIAADPSNSEYRIAMGRIMLKLPNYLRHAENAYLMAIELSPDNADYYAELGLLYQQLSQVSQAREMMRKALLLDPNNPVALRADLD